jgi:hypothetical protein
MYSALQLSAQPRGHIEGDATSSWDIIRRGSLADTEDSRWSSGQKHSATIGGKLVVTGDYRDWGDFDHFTQSLVNASEWDGQAVSPVLEAMGYTETSSSLSAKFASPGWSGSMMSEWMTTVSNAGWTAGKAVGLIAGSKPDWAQFTAAERGTSYATALRRSLKKTGGDFCKALALRAQSSGR